MMEIAGYEFKGPFKDVEQVSELQIGVYVVICLVDDEPHCVLDIGTSEGGTRADVTSTGNLRHRLKRHDRKGCWDENVHGEIAYCVKYIKDDEERLGLESELMWKLEHPCGTNPWVQIEEAWERYQGYEEDYGERGSFDI